jgi:predicted nucleotidyltransferase
MPALDPRHALLRRQWAEESERLEQRRQQLLAAAGAAALALRERWPDLEAVWLFGSAAGPGTLCHHSDLDLAVAGLPPEDQIAALGVVERVVDGALAAAGEAGLAIDLVRLEDLAPHWQARIRQRALPLS